MLGHLFKDHDFGLTRAQTDAVKDVLAAVARKKAAAMRGEMREAARLGGQRRLLRFKDGNGGEVSLMIHPFSYHYWGQRLGYQCWEDGAFLREYWRDNPEARVRSVADSPVVVVQGNAPRAKRFSKVYPSGTVSGKVGEPVSGQGIHAPTHRLTHSPTHAPAVSGKEVTCAA
jgi:hypothetical protein